MLDRWVEESELRHVAALASGVPDASVAVIDDAAQLVSVPDSVPVLLEWTRQHRDFPLQVLVVLRDDDLVRRFGGFEGVRNVGRVLAMALGATVLFGEGPLAPSEWVRVRSIGDLDVVSLDTDETAG